MCGGGYLAYYGGKDKFLEYFKKENSINIYTELHKAENARIWYEKWFANFDKKQEKPATISEVKSSYPFFRQLKSMIKVTWHFCWHKHQLLLV